MYVRFAEQKSTSLKRNLKDKFRSSCLSAESCDKKGKSKKSI